MINPKARKPTETRRVATELLHRTDTARALHEPTIEQLQHSIREYGLIQPITVIENDDGYGIVCGNHRFEAILRIGLTETDTLVLPKGTSREEVLAKSLHENHIRHDETLPDIMKRVHALAEYHDCPFEEAAKLAGVSPSKFSKIRTALDKLCPRALAIIAERRIGVSVAYEVARAAADEEQQVEWLLAHAEGKMSRDVIASTANRGSRKPKRVRLAVSFEDVRVQIMAPIDTDYEGIQQALAKLKTLLTAHARQQHPIEVLPRLLQAQT